MPIQEGDIVIEEAQKSLDFASEVKLHLTLPVFLDHSLCNTHKTLCIILSGDLNATYVESNFDNNMFCQNIRQHVECYPGEWYFIGQNNNIHSTNRNLWQTVLS